MSPRAVSNDDSSARQSVSRVGGPPHACLFSHPIRRECTSRSSERHVRANLSPGVLSLPIQARQPIRQPIRPGRQDPVRRGQPDALEGQRSRIVAEPSGLPRAIPAAGGTSYTLGLRIPGEAYCPARRAAPRRSPHRCRSERVHTRVSKLGSVRWPAAQSRWGSSFAVCPSVFGQAGARSARNLGTLLALH